MDTSHPAVQMVATAAKRQQGFKPGIPIGMRGTLKGVEYECIGGLMRRDNHGDAWREYLLFNPFAGFRWLVAYQGHWSFVEMLLEEPARTWRRRWDGEPYRLFGRGVAEVVYVVGEFYWQVRRGERPRLPITWLRRGSCRASTMTS